MTSRASSSQAGPGGQPRSNTTSAELAAIGSSARVVPCSTRRRKPAHHDREVEVVGEDSARVEFVLVAAPSPCAWGRLGSHRPESRGLRRHRLQADARSPIAGSCGLSRGGRALGSAGAALACHAQWNTPAYQEAQSMRCSRPTSCSRVSRARRGACEGTAMFCGTLAVRARSPRRAIRDRVARPVKNRSLRHEYSNRALESRIEGPREA